MAERDAALSEEALFKGMVRTPAWRRLVRRLTFRRDAAMRRIMQDATVDPVKVAADKREWNLLNALLTDPVKFLLELAHAQELAQGKEAFPADEDAEFAGDDEEARDE